MLFRFISRLKFIIKSTNQHGIHSPFVYDFTTKGLYSPHLDRNVLNHFKGIERLTDKEKKILSRIVNYFKNYRNEDIIPIYLPSIFDIEKREQLFTRKKEYFIIHGIHKRKEALEQWNDLIQENLATVTIDLYYFGLIFIRPEQVKEHFIIRV